MHPGKGGITLRKKGNLRDDKGRGSCIKKRKKSVGDGVTLSDPAKPNAKDISTRVVLKYI